MNANNIKIDLNNKDSSLIESYDYEYIDVWSFPKRGYKLLSEKRLFPAQYLSKPLAKKINSIKCSNPEYIPAAVYLKDGSYLPRVVFINEMTVLRRYIKFWLLFIRPKNISKIELSRFQIPPKIAKKLWQVGETSMSSLEFEIFMHDETILPCWYSGPSDFIILPSSYTPNDIKKVKIERGLVASQKNKNILTEPNHIWCIYRSKEFTLPP